MTNYSSKERTQAPVVVLLLLLLAGVAAATGILAMRGGEEVTTPSAPAPQLLTDTAAPLARQFSFGSVPGWLFVHVGAIAALQIVALLFAVRRASRITRSREDVKVIQFLVEIPMYLGLFGTLLGVCLTQFIAGSLVAPLAYMTTMSGIVLHVLGKLTILLPLPEHSGLSEE
jgi:hypothetical protein